MSEFSYVLSRHIHGKNIKTYALAQYCGLDRSNMYKIINGKRKPTSVDMVHKMARFMHLSPSEEKELEEAYQITLAGYDNYYRRKDVMNFFAEFNLGTASLPAFIYDTEAESDEEILLLNSPIEVKQALFRVVSSEMSRKGIGMLKLLIQPDCEFLINLISAESQAETNIHIEHIICLNNNAETTLSQKNYNLNCLKQILPLYGGFCNYECYYYYNDIVAKTGDLTLFPYMLVTSDSVCLLTANMTKGYITRSVSSVQMFLEIFSDYKSLSNPLLHNINDVSSQLAYVSRLMGECGTGCCFQMTPCLTPFLTSQHAEKYIKKDLPNRATFISHFKEYTKESSSWFEKGSVSIIFSFDGVNRFLQSGRIGEYPSDVYHPFDMPDRIYFIKKIIQACKNMNCRMLKDSIGNPEYELYLFVNQKSGYLMFTSPHNGNPVYLDIEEPGLLFTFYDFCENLDDNMFYTSLETEKLLNDLIKTSL